MKKIKTLIIEDSGLMRIMISDALRADPAIEVVGTATNGKDGFDKVLQLHPDVVISDMVMPEYDGLFAVKNIMAKSPVPVILMSALGKTNPEIFDALNAGAFDFIDKPKTKDASDFKRSLKALKTKIKTAYEADYNVLGRQVNKINHHKHSFVGVLQYEVLVIGASTGGPSTIESIVTQLPENLAIPVIVVQHMPERFLISYAKRLKTMVPLNICMAEEHTYLEPRTVYIAAGNGNMMVSQKRGGKAYFTYSDKKFKEFNNPSVDCMMESVARVFGAKSIGLILTGMGKDGASGLCQIKQKGGLTIAQDAASCIVNGMPQAAVNAGVIDYVVKLREIPGFIVSCF